MAQLAHAFRLDLPNPLAGHTVHFADLFQRSLITVHQAETHLEDLPLALGEAGEHVAQFLLEQTVAGHFGWVFGALVFDKIADADVAVVSDRRVERDWLL